MRCVFALAGLVAVAVAGKTITETAVVDVTVTSCEAAPTDCSYEWEETSVPVEVTSTSTYWSDAAVPTSTSVAPAVGASTWLEVPAPAASSTSVAPAVGASTWLEVPVAATSSTTVKPVASFTKPAPVATYTGGASNIAGAGLAGVAAVAAMLL